MGGTNEMHYYVAEYFEKKELASLGYQFDADNLYPDQVQAFSIIGSQINKLKAKDAESSKRKAPRKK